MPTSPVPVPAGPPVPDSSNTESTFDAQWEAFNGWVKNDLQPGVNALAVNVKSNADEAVAAAATATTQALAASGSAAAAGAVAWISGTTYAAGDARYSPIDAFTYRRKTAGAGTTDPALDATNWTYLGPVQASEFTFVAAGAISGAGKALTIDSTGKVKESLIASASAGTHTTFNAAQTSAVSIIYDPVAAKHAIFYLDTADAGKGKVILATVAANNSITFGTPTVFASSIGGAQGAGLSTCFDPVTGQIVVGYIRGTDTVGMLMTAKIAGAAITFGTAVASGLLINALGVCYDKSVNRLLVNCFEPTGQGQKCIVASVSGTAITFGAQITVLSSGGNGSTGSVVHCDSLLTNAIAYNTGARGQVRQVKIDPSTFIPSMGTALSISDGSGFGGYLTGDRCLAWIDSLQRLAAIFENGPSGNYTITVGLLSSTGTTWQYAVSTSSGFPTSNSAPYQHHKSIGYSAASKALCISYPDTGASLFGKFHFSSTLTAGSVSFGAATQFQSSATDMTVVCSDDATTQVLVATFDNTNPAGAVIMNGSVVAATAAVPDSRTSFIGFSKAAASKGANVAVKLPFGVDTNQTGLTPNGLYYLSSTNGQTLTTVVSGPAVARALSATSILVLGTNVFP